MKNLSASENAPETPVPKSQGPPRQVLESPLSSAPDLSPATLIKSNSTTQSDSPPLVSPEGMKGQPQDPSGTTKTPRKLPEVPSVTPRTQDLVSLQAHPIEMPTHCPQVPDEKPPPVPPPRMPAMENLHFASVCQEGSPLGSSFKGGADEGEQLRSQEPAKSKVVEPTPAEYGDGDIDEVSVSFSFSQTLFGG